MYLWAIYIFPRSVHLFSCSRIGRSIVGIYKSLTDTWMWKFGLWPRNFFSGNICFQFSVLCLCSVYRITCKQGFTEYFEYLAVVNSNLAQFLPADKSLFLKSVFPVFFIQLIAGAKWNSLPFTAGLQSPCLVKQVLFLMSVTKESGVCFLELSLHLCWATII